ncbi:MAG: hypothetical protein WA892_03590 [Ornithinimicrobium sp.]
MKFDMGSATLDSLTRATQGSHQDLGALVADLVRAVEPLEGSFNGAGRAAFDRFKADTDAIVADLHHALASILQGQADLDLAFRTGDQESSDHAVRAQGRADFDGARFASRA